MRDFDYVAELFDQKIVEIVEECMADDFYLYATRDEKLSNLSKREDPFYFAYGTSFREQVAITKPYKGHRHQDKPLHFHNLRAYVYGKYKNKLSISVDGLEADDEICIDLYDPSFSRVYNYIACSRDKDLRQVPGKHFSWACGNTPASMIMEVDEHGMLWMDGDKLRGYGNCFFYAQMLTGDPTDNIPGIPKIGPKKAYNALIDCKDEEQLFNVVSSIYKDKIGENWREYYREQADLLWMIREYDDEGVPLRHVIYDERRTHRL